MHGCLIIHQIKRYHFTGNRQLPFITRVCNMKDGFFTNQRDKVKKVERRQLL